MDRLSCRGLLALAAGCLIAAAASPDHHLEAADVRSAAAIRAAVIDPVRLETDHLELAVCRKSRKWYLRMKPTIRREEGTVPRLSLLFPDHS